MSDYDQNLFLGIVLYTYAENIKFLPFSNSSINSEQHKKPQKTKKQIIALKYITGGLQPFMP